MFEIFLYYLLLLYSFIQSNNTKLTYQLMEFDAALKELFHLKVLNLFSSRSSVSSANNKKRQRIHLEDYDGISMNIYFQSGLKEVGVAYVFRYKECHV
jgi:hypothetical protein